MSMGKWRGFGGVTNHWGVQMESLTLMAGIAPATQRVKLWTTIHPLLQNPAVAAKMIATLDHISGGRAGLNIVAGAYKAEFDQMGAWDGELDHDDRYTLAEEWTTIIKRLWSEPSVTFEGRFFQMKDCRSEPKPLSRPRPDLISAGMSERGFDFAVREADACFIGGRTADERRSFSRRGKAVAASYGKSVKTYAMCTVIYAETDAKAETLAERYRQGVDMGAVIEMLKNWGAPPERLLELAEQQGAFMTQTVVGSPATCRDRIEDFLDYCELDGLMLIFPDYVEGLEMFGADILPDLRAEAA
jgi:pyrimidine oxygenase